MTAYIESAAGVAEGARTGLHSVFVGMMFLAAIFAYFILSEHIRALQVAGGALILAGILVERARRRAAVPVE